MGREIRRVPANWEHPRDDRGGYIPLHEGYAVRVAEFEKMQAEKGIQEAIEYYGCPDKNDFMPDWADSEKTHLMMYETCSEGTPISPAFATPEELARWLADTGASSFGSMTATYEQWLATCRRGWAVSAVMDSKGFRSGVEMD